MAVHQQVAFGTLAGGLDAAGRSVAVVVFRRSGAGIDILCLLRNPQKGSFWQSVSGAVEPNEEPRAAAAREVAEETGLATRLVDLVDLDYSHTFVNASGIIIREWAFAREVLPAADIRRSSEHVAERWTTPEEAARLFTHESNREMIRRLLKTLNQPVLF